MGVPGAAGLPGPPPPRARSRGRRRSCRRAPRVQRGPAGPGPGRPGRGRARDRRLFDRRTPQTSRRQTAGANPMTTMVCFRSDGASYCLPVEATRAVRTADGLVPVPGSGPDIAGVLPGGPPLTVLSALGAGGSHVIVVESRGASFGLLVDSVSGLRRFADDEVRPAPTGQDVAFICGLVDSGGDLILVADPEALAARL
ncbi:hypothetical protein E3T48_10700 [Cryobacterium fucosi]|uniref:CheW-like domain-containing protein n=2 Tax=Cryobacterium fucosi TaxID=1259157 RepID=A0A4R9B5Q7_9MICO|nr:hypothetical protein E3T48_10700 [Cryobacterium fucosi]